MINEETRTQDREGQQVVEKQVEVENVDASNNNNNNNPSTPSTNKKRARRGLTGNNTSDAKHENGRSEEPENETPTGRRTTRS